MFGKKSYFYKVKKNTKTIEADNILEGEDGYYFNPYSVRDDTAKALVEHSLDSESLTLIREVTEDENIGDDDGEVSAAL
jgi:hypothetical protein